MSEATPRPWLGYSLTALIRDVTDQGTFTLEVRRRPDVATRRWYTASWVGADGGAYTAEASDLQTLLRRAAETEQMARMDQEEEWGE